MPPGRAGGVRAIGHIFAEMNANTLFSFLSAPSAPLSHPLRPPHALRAPSRTSPRLLPLSFLFFPLYPRTPPQNGPIPPFRQTPQNQWGVRGGSCHQGGVRATDRFSRAAEISPTVCVPPVRYLYDNALPPPSGLTVSALRNFVLILLQEPRATAVAVATGAIRSTVQ